MKNNNSKEKIKLVIVVLLMVITLGTISYGAFFMAMDQDGENLINSGCFETDFSEKTNSIKIQNAIPTSDDDGLKSDPYVINLKNNCTVTAGYKVYIARTNDSFSNYYIKISTDGYRIRTLPNLPLDNSVKESGYSDMLVAASGKLAQGESKDINIRLWLAENVSYNDVSGKKWEGQVKVVSYATK